MRGNHARADIERMTYAQLLMFDREAAAFETALLSAGAGAVMAAMGGGG